ncbi:WDFY2-like protein [Mya arenaria]|uniref:WDFY2-like protein n=1 Tax=Mya arenaria TaxID=6604 RepID=A0ABY7G1J7_MYAAR|nr:WDFY2-like protein [Mya arenaria]
MAAEIKPTNKNGSGNIRKPVLVNKVEGFSDEINMACIIPREEGVISVSDDKTVRVWLRRDTGQYWPSICHSMPAHQSRVMSVKFSLQREWVLSCGKDKYFQWHCSETGRRLGGYQASAWCLCLDVDEQSNYVFVGDYSGQVSVLKITDQNFNHITTLKGHSGSVRSLAWDPDRNLLFSGSYDNSIIVWDIGGKQGTAFELQGHKDKVQALVYCTASKQLISTADDKVIGIWDMDANRVETPEWDENDHCQKCEKPFFWNFRKMWEERTIGIRQHHCRKCGKAVCEKCSCKRSTIPPMGYEYEVRVCDDCFEKITDEERAPLATFHDAKHSVTYMHLEIWDIGSVLHTH